MNIYCAKCNEKMKAVILSTHEYVKGSILHDVRAYECEICGKVFFSEEQDKQMEEIEKTKKLIKNGRFLTEAEARKKLRIN